MFVAEQSNEVSEVAEERVSSSGYKSTHTPKRPLPLCVLGAQKEVHVTSDTTQIHTHS